MAGSGSQQGKSGVFPLAHSVSNSPSGNRPVTLDGPPEGIPEGIRLWSSKCDAPPDCLGMVLGQAGVLPVKAPDGPAQVAVATDRGIRPCTNLCHASQVAVATECAASESACARVSSPPRGCGLAPPHWADRRAQPGF